jgi:hypothetical protein
VKKVRFYVPYANGPPKRWHSGCPHWARIISLQTLLLKSLLLRCLCFSSAIFTPYCTAQEPTLSFGTIFAWSNFAYMAYSHYHATVNSFTCTVGADNSLYTTPCFIGSVLFLLSLAAGLATWLNLRKANQPS